MVAVSYRKCCLFVDYVVKNVCHCLFLCNYRRSALVSAPSDGVAKTFEETTSLVYAAAVFKEATRLKSAVASLGFWAKVGT